MFRLLRTVILLLSLSGAGLAQDITLNPLEEESTPPARAEENTPALNLGDLLPRSQDNQAQDSQAQDNRPQTERGWYTITDRPPPARRRVETIPPPEQTQAQPPEQAQVPPEPAPAPEQTQARTETAPAREAREVSPPLPEQEAAPGNQTAQAPALEPPPAAAARDLSFLEGCWRVEERDWCGDENKILGWIEYCFDRPEEGLGKRTIHIEEPNHYAQGTYHGGFNNYFDQQERLIIETTQAINPDGTRVDVNDRYSNDRYRAEWVVITGIQANSLSGTITGPCRGSAPGLWSGIAVGADPPPGDFAFTRPVTLRRQQPR